MDFDIRDLVFDALSEFEDELANSYNAWQNYITRIRAKFQETVVNARARSKEAKQTSDIQSRNETL